MRLLVVVILGALAARPAAAAQRPATSSSPNPPPSAADTNTPADINLPVSLEKIRESLGRPVPLSLLKRFADTPTYRLEIEERRRIDELLTTLDFKAGPTPPGGLYNFEQQRLVFPPTDKPLAQPYAAFNTGQLLTVAAENLAARALAGPVVESVSRAQRRRAQDSARRVVDAAIADYCNGKPEKGAGIPLCDQQPVDH